jgi:hypothetical protein
MREAVRVSSREKGVVLVAKIKFEGPEAQAELASFYQWLQREPDVRQRAEVSFEAAPPSPGDMGTGWADVVQFILDDGFQAASLAIAYSTWRSSRALQKFRVTVSSGDTSVTIDCDDPEAGAVIASTVAKDLGNA